MTVAKTKTGNAHKMYISLQTNNTFANKIEFKNKNE